MTIANSVMALETDHLLQVYRRGQVVFERGKGCRLFDADGRGYLDLISGVGVASLGHAHPRLAAAIAEQASTLLHTSNLFFHPLQGEVAARLAALSGLPRAFFTNSGTEAVEACLKFARRVLAHAEGAAQRLRRLRARLSRPNDGIALGDVGRALPRAVRAAAGDVQWVSTDNPDALRAAVTDRTAAIVVEPLQGEGGVRPLSAAMAAAIRESCARTGALLITDEVQSGLGRTGRPFYAEALGLTPDLMALGKALGAGVPIGAAMFSERVASSASFGDHGSTYGGNLLACRAALVFLEELVDRDLISNVAKSGQQFESALQRIAAKYPHVLAVRGAGLIWGIELDRPAAPVVEAALKLGLLVNRTADTVVRLLPPFIISSSEISEGVALLEQAIGSVAGGAA